MPDAPHQDKRQGISFFSLTKSLISGLFGIQTQSNQEQDFHQGKPIDFIITGVIGVILLLITLIVIVNFII